MILQHNDCVRKLDALKHKNTQSINAGVVVKKEVDGEEEEEEEDMVEQIIRMEDKIVVLRDEINELKEQVEGN